MADLSRFHYQISGNDQGHKLVFLHGLLGSAANWRGVTPAFQDRFHILTYDQRGHGRSFKPKAGYSPMDYAIDLQEILGELGWDQVHLVGHSMGGRNALEFAKLSPQSLKSLVIEDIGVNASGKAVASIEKLLSLVPRPFENRKAAREFFTNEYPRLISYNPKAHDLSQYFYSNITDTPDGKADWRFSLDGVRESLKEGRKEDRWDLIEELTTPTLYIRGEYSEELPREIFEETLRRNPSIQGVEIQGAAHWVHFDEPQSFIQVVNDFLTLQL